jgi:hypothetical protein
LGSASSLSGRWAWITARPGCFAVASSVAFGAWLRLAYGATIVERSQRAVTVRIERRGSRCLSLRQRLGLGAVVGLIGLLTVTLTGNVLVRKAQSDWSPMSSPPQLHDSGRLPVIGGPSGKSRIEPRYSRVVSSVAGVGAEVRCWSVADWRKRQVEWGNWRGQELGPWGAYATSGRFRVHLSPAICATLARLAYDHVPVREDPWPGQLAWSVGALAHEAQHVRGVLDEGTAECFGRAVDHEDRGGSGTKQRRRPVSRAPVLDVDVPRARLALPS